MFDNVSFCLPLSHVAFCFISFCLPQNSFGVDMQQLYPPITRAFDIFSM